MKDDEIINRCITSRARKAEAEGCSADLPNRSYCDGTRRARRSGTVRLHFGGRGDLRVPFAVTQTGAVRFDHGASTWREAGSSRWRAAA